jgi:hypothetical protein
MVSALGCGSRLRPQASRYERVGNEAVEACSGIDDWWYKRGSTNGSGLGMGYYSRSRASAGSLEVFASVGGNGR